MHFKSHLETAGCVYWEGWDTQGGAYNAAGMRLGTFSAVPEPRETRQPTHGGVSERVTEADLVVDNPLVVSRVSMSWVVWRQLVILLSLRRLSNPYAKLPAPPRFALSLHPFSLV